MNVIEYYKDYLNLKAHFNTKKFYYGKNFIPYMAKWNKEPEARKDWWRRIQQDMLLTEFRKMTIAYLVDEPKAYYLKFDKTSEIVIDFNRYWSNYLYWFEKDLKSTEKKRFETICICYYVNLNYNLPNKYFTKLFEGEDEIRIKKYLHLFQDKLDWEALKNVIIKIGEEK